MAHPFIEKLFKRAEVDNVSQLNADEKITYDQLIKDLQVRTKPITSEDWSARLQEQLTKTIEQFDPDASEKKKDFLWSQIYLLQKLLVYLNGPKQEEENIKKEYNI